MENGNGICVICLTLPQRSNDRNLLDGRKGDIIQ